jgi:hypothetical protein
MKQLYIYEWNFVCIIHFRRIYYKMCLRRPYPFRKYVNILTAVAKSTDVSEEHVTVTFSVENIELHVSIK